MKYKKQSLFILGLLLGFFGFSLAHEKEIPLVSHMLYGKVNAIRSGFNKVCGLPVKLENVSNRYRKVVTGDLTLKIQDDGFNGLSEFLMKDLKRKESEYFAKTWDGTLSYEDFKTRALKDGFSKMTYQGIPGDGTGINIPIGNNRINAYLNNSPNEYASFFVYKVDKGIEKEYRSITFAWASLIYFTGLFIQIFQFDWGKQT